MKSDALMLALGSVDSRYLEQCDAAPVQTKRFSPSGPARRILIAAAVIALLAASVSAAFGLAHVRGKRLGRESFLLYLAENPAAEDAPTSIEAYCLPQTDPEELLLTHVDENPGHGITLTWEKADGSGSVRFCQTLLTSIPDDGVLTLVEGVDPDDLIPGEAEIMGRRCSTLTWESEAGETVWYYWVDEARHYLFSMSFTDGVSREEREALVGSVRPVSASEARTEMGIPADGYWSISPDASRFQLQDRASITRIDELPALHLEWEDGSGSGIVLEQNMGRGEDEFQGCAWAQRELDGISVQIGTRASDRLQEEYWRFTMPDGAAMILAFWYPADAPMEDAVKQEVFESLHPLSLPEP